MSHNFETVVLIIAVLFGCAFFLVAIFGMRRPPDDAADTRNIPNFVPDPIVTQSNELLRKSSRSITPTAERRDGVVEKARTMLDEVRRLPD